MGEDPVAVAEYFGSRKRINHVHYRNVLVVKPYEQYQELFIDAGQGDMFGVMKASCGTSTPGRFTPNIRARSTPTGTAAASAAIPAAEGTRASPIAWLIPGP